VANGGMLMRPLLVRRVVDASSGATLTRFDPTPVRRAASRQSAATLTRWLEGVVTDQHGTGRRARLDLWRVAGKTGTAQKVDHLTRRYSADKRFSSFVGFAPAEAPRVVIGVFIDEPRGEVYGGEVAAPVFREVAEYALKSLGVPPSEGMQPAVAEAAEPPPAEPSELPDPPAMDDVAPQPEGTSGVAVPTLIGLPARSALRALEAVELTVELQGTGRVASQAPLPGQVVEPGSRVRLVLTPQS
jgi:cell division protein FtsI (penicillin-binding protein 3)